MVLTEQLPTFLAATELLRQVLHVVVIPTAEAPLLELLTETVDLISPCRLVVGEEEMALATFG